MGTATYTWTAAGGSSGSWIINERTAKQAKPVDYKMQLELYRYHESLLSSISGYGAGTVSYQLSSCATWQDSLWSDPSASNMQRCSSTGFTTNWPTGTEWNAAYARAYSKFLGAITERAQMMTNFAERGETVEMLTHRLGQLYKGAMHLRKGEFRDFCRTFGIKPKPKHRSNAWSRPQDFSNLWLEYWFGWAPTINDIYTAVETYGSPIPDGLIKHGSARPIKRTYSTRTTYGTVSSSCMGSVRVGISGRVKVDNPSLFEANRMGLVNPAATALELIPFSWLAGWFVNLAQVLQQYTDFVGLTLTDATVSTKTHQVYSYSRLDRDGYYRRWSIDYKSYARRKVQTLPRVKLVVGLPNGLSVTRGATLASLIVQIFSPKKR